MVSEIGLEIVFYLADLLVLLDVRYVAILEILINVIRKGQK